MAATVTAIKERSRLVCVEKAWRDLLVGLGYNLNDPHLVDTPSRVARFLVGWHSNVGEDPPKMTTFPNDGTDQMVAVGHITFFSMCAHHGLPFYGTAAVGYLPRAKLVGLSKLARAVDYFSRRFQTQEQITREVAGYLEEQLRPKGVGVVLRAEHLCMSLRGIQKPGHFTVTSEMRGAFRREASTRAELLALVASDV